MRLRFALISAFLLASCTPVRPAGGPTPSAGPTAVAPVPVPPPTSAASRDTIKAAAPPAEPAIAPAPAAAVAPADSIALAKQARDSALDAAVLERLATAKPPESPESAAA